VANRFVIARNILANWSGLAVSTLVSFLLAPFILHKLGNAGYGVWMLAISLTGYLGLLELGIRSSVVRYVSKHRAGSDYDNLNQVVNTALVSFGLAGLLALAIGTVLGIASSSIFNIPADLENQATWVIILISATLTFSFGTGVFASTLVGIERFDLLNLSMSVGNLLRAGLVVIILPGQPNLITLGLISLISALVSFLMIIYFAFTREPNLRINLKLANTRTLKSIFNYGIFSFLIIVATRVAYYSDNTVIGIFGTTEMITYFAIGAIGVEFLRRIVNSLTTVLMPIASGLEASGTPESLKRLLTSATKYTFLLVLPASTILLVMGQTLLGVWMGEEYAEKSYVILVVLLIPLIYSLSQFSTEEILLGTGRHKLFSFVTVAEATTNLGLSIVLIKPLGILGVALGTSIPVVLFRILLSPIFVKRITKSSFLLYLRESLLGPLLICIPVVILALLLESFLSAESLLEFFLQAVLLLSVYYLLAWRFVIEESLKQSLLDRMGKLIK
jgi:O-antigen/teichoic acid export membrane protein